MKCEVTEIQVGGFHICHSLEDMCREYLDMLKDGNAGIAPRTKIYFSIETRDGDKGITIREDDGIVAYGDFDGLESFLDYAQRETGRKIT